MVGEILLHTHLLCRQISPELAEVMLESSLEHGRVSFRKNSSARLGAAIFVFDLTCRELAAFVGNDYYIDAKSVIIIIVNIV